MSFPSDLVGLNPFQAAWLDSTSSRQLVWSWSLLFSFACLNLLCTLVCLRVTLGSFIAHSGREGPSEFGQFQGLPEAILN